jgi:hypothetical protein
MLKVVWVGLPVLLAALPGPANALRTHSAPIDSQAGAFALQGKATCAEGERVVSGGFSGSPGDFAIVNRAVRGSAWVVKGSFSPGASVFAYCSERLQVRVVKKSEVFDSRARGRVSAECPGDQYPAGGGWAFGDLSLQRPIISSASNFRSWRVVSDRGDVGGSLTAYAYCLKRSPVTYMTSTSLTAGATAGKTTTCEFGRPQLLGGGFETFLEPGEPRPQPVFYESRRTGQVDWTASAVNYGEDRTTLLVFADCLA